MATGEPGARGERPGDNPRGATPPQPKQPASPRTNRDGVAAKLSLAAPPSQSAIGPSSSASKATNGSKTTRRMAGNGAQRSGMLADVGIARPAASAAAEDEQQSRLSRFALRSGPPWLLSGLIHMVALIVLGLLWTGVLEQRSITLETVWSEEAGKQLDETVALATDDDPEAEEIITPDNLPEVEDPFAAPPSLDVALSGDTSSSDIAAPQIGLALEGRDEGMKRALLAKYGGNAATEAAVLAGLEWLARQQRKDGSWSLSGPYSGGSSFENVESATAMALIAFQGAGHTHLRGKFKNEVSRGIKALLNLQDQKGNFWQGITRHDSMYCQAQATIAVCELYGMTGDPDLRAPAQLAVDYCLDSQGELGGWRYRPRNDSDTSVTGWMVMALESAKMAGLDVPSPNLEMISSFLDKVQHEGGSKYGYQPGTDPSLPMTAEGLLCRQYLGWAQNDERLIRGADYLARNLMQWEDRDVYYWYYATQVMHHMEGSHWQAWNDVMRDLLPSQQVTEGRERGSWDPLGDHPDRWANRGRGGRLYVTCLSIYMLEVYYRHLPIYRTERFLRATGQ